MTKSEWKISFCVITLNEEESLGRCLSSFNGLADEIVVVDSGSQDRTCEIAGRFGARVIREPWRGYVGQKNFALEAASHRWVFSIDADEALSKELKLELARLKSNGEPSGLAGYSMPRCVFYRGRWIRHGDWYPDRLVRLFRKDQARFRGGKVHERLEVEGTVESLRSDLEHYSFKDALDFKRRSDHYARLWAETKHAEGKRAGPWAPLLHASHRWLRGLLYRGGLLDGRRGWEIAGLSAREVYLKYRYLRRLGDPGGGGTGVQG